MKSTLYCDDCREKLERYALDRDVGGCWEWLGAKNKGYGVVKLGGVTCRAHRVSFEVHNGPIPPGSLCRHTCDNRSCINPDHLLLGSHADNSNDMVVRGRSPLGTRNAHAVLSEQDVANVVEMLPFHDNKTIASIYGVTRRAIWAIRNGRSWRHITGFERRPVAA